MEDMLAEAAAVTALARAVRGAVKAGIGDDRIRHAVGAAIVAAVKSAK